MVAFEYAADCNVIGIESDVIIRWKLFWSCTHIVWVQILLPVSFRFLHDIGRRLFTLNCTAMLCYSSVGPIICKITFHCDRRKRIKTHIISTCLFNTTSSSSSCETLCIWFSWKMFTLVLQYKQKYLHCKAQQAHPPWKSNSVVCFEVSRTICGRQNYFRFGASLT